MSIFAAPRSVRSSWLLRTALVGLAALALALQPGDALAKGKGKGKGKSKGGAKAKSSQVELTGNHSLDAVFKQLKTLDQAVTGAEHSRSSGKHNMTTAMGLPKDAKLSTVVKHVQAQSQGKVKIAMNGGKPQLQASDALPEKLKTEIEAINGALTDYADAIKNVSKIPKEAAQLSKKVQTFPADFKKEVMSNPLGAVSLLKDLGTIKDNIKVAKGLPKRATTVTKELNADIKVIVTAFGGTWPPALSKK